MNYHQYRVNIHENSEVDENNLRYDKFEVTITPYGEEMRWDMDAPEECPCCGVWQGEDHEEGCEIAECAECNATVDECRCHWES